MFEWPESGRGHPTPKRKGSKTSVLRQWLVNALLDIILIRRRSNNVKGQEIAQDATAWAEKFRLATESDPIIQSYAKYYTCDFLLGLEELRVGVQMRDGQMHNIEINPAPLEPH